MTYWLTQSRKARKEDRKKPIVCLILTILFILSKKLFLSFRLSFCLRGEKSSLPLQIRVIRVICVKLFPSNPTMRRSRFPIICLLLLLLCVAHTLAAPVPPSPFDTTSLIILNADSLIIRGENGPTLDTNPDTVFSKTVAITGPLALRAQVRTAGDYELWVRISNPKSPTSLNVEVTRKNLTTLRAEINKDAGSVKEGGPAGFDAYAKSRVKITTHPRVEKPGDALPFYWWRAGSVHLQPGACTIRLTPSDAKPGAEPTRFDTAILTTAKLTYPFAGDLTLPRASYIRFRIDAIPETAGKLGISGKFLTHVPHGFHSDLAHFTPTGLAPAAEPFLKTGFTPWYCLQDIPNSPKFEATDVTLYLTTTGTPGTPADPAKGVTQLANYPQQDFIVGQFDWSDPESLSISMDMDFEKSLDKLRNIRDHAREHYDLAMAATGGKIHPLTRGPLYFAHGWGMATGGTYDYMLKTLRTLGMNVATLTDQPGSTRDQTADRYGWWLQMWVGSNAPVGLDEEATNTRVQQSTAKQFANLPPAVASKMVIGQIADETLETVIAPNPAGHAAFRKWAQQQGLTPESFSVDSWEKVEVVPTGAGAIKDAPSRRMHYWTRRFQAYLNTHWFDIVGKAIEANAPVKGFRPFVALGGHQLYFPGAMPQDLFGLGSYASFMGGISDWMTQGSWRWDSHQIVAFSMAFFNAGARRHGQPPISFPMSHTAWPTPFRAYTLLANNAKTLSFWTFGPIYASPEGDWSEAPESYRAVNLTANRATYFDDILPSAAMRPSRVAMLYSHSNDYWSPGGPAFADKRATFLALSHEYFQPELVTEDQIAQGCLKNYDAVYVLDVAVAAKAQEAIKQWVDAGGTLWACADAMTSNEFYESTDGLEPLGIHRELAGTIASNTDKAAPNSGVAAPGGSISAVHVKAMEAAASANAIAAAAAQPTGPVFTMSPVEGGPEFRPHTVVGPRPAVATAQGAKVRARYNDASAAWLELQHGKGRVIYVAHRAGITYSAKAVRLPGWEVAWAETGRAPIVAPLLDAKVARELVLSESAIMAQPLSTGAGTVIPIYNMNPYPIPNLKLRLREPAAPLSVLAFDPDKPGPPVTIPSEFSDGVLTITLPFPLAADEGAQMVCVRRAAPSKDERLDAMRKNTQRLLDSKEPGDLSAGAFFAGAFPEWGFAGLLIPLLEHDRWEVRRQAVESLGKLDYRAAREKLEAMTSTETDSHVLGDCILALARLDSFNALNVCLEQVESKSPFVRKESLIAANMVVDRRIADSKLTAGDRNIAFQIVEVGLSHKDPRVRQPAIELFAKLAPEDAFDRLTAASRKGAPPMRDAETWAKAIAANDLLFQKWIEAQMPGGPNFLLRVSLVRAPTTAIADAIRKAIEVSTPEQPMDESLLLQAIARQQNRALMRTVYEKRGRIPFGVLRQMTRLLETVYRAKLGGVGADWDRWLQENRE